MIRKLLINRFDAHNIRPSKYLLSGWLLDCAFPIVLVYVGMLVIGFGSVLYVWTHAIGGANRQALDLAIPSILLLALAIPIRRMLVYSWDQYLSARFTRASSYNLRIVTTGDIRDLVERFTGRGIVDYPTTLPQDHLVAVPARYTAQVQALLDHHTVLGTRIRVVPLPKDYRFRTWYTMIRPLS